MTGAAVVLRALRTLRPGTLATTSGWFSAPTESVLPPPSCVRCPPWRSCPVRALRLSSASRAGHNKWSKVKNIKGPKDEARSRMFMKLTLMIRIAVREGGPNPDMNINLAQVLEQCRNKNMPKASIETAMKAAGKPMSQHVFEARGPGGCLLLIEALTDNHSRSQQDIKRLLIRNGGMLSDGARHNFEKRGTVVVPGQNVSTERALELAIEVGAEDVQETEDEEEQPILKFICDMMDMGKVRASLEQQGMPIMSAGLEFVPRTLLSLDEDNLNAASTLIETLTDCPDVVRVWDNIQAES